MKLRDPGTIIDPDVTSTDFMGRRVSAIRLTCDGEWQYGGTGRGGR